MTDTQTQALAKIDEGAKAAGFGRVADAMKDFVATALRDFIRQDAEFAQAVVQGGSFAECMSAVAKGVGSHISDFDAYGKAAAFYFPGCKIRYKMELDLIGDTAAEEPAELRSRPVEVAVEVDEEAVKKAAAEAKAEAEGKAKTKLDKLKTMLDAATQELEAYKDGDNRELEQSRARAAALEKELAEERERARKAAEMQDAAVAAFGVHFANVQRDFNDLMGALGRIRTATPETAEKLTAAVRALIEKMGGIL